MQSDVDAAADHREHRQREVQPKNGSELGWQSAQQLRAECEEQNTVEGNESDGREQIDRGHFARADLTVAIAFA